MGGSRGSELERVALLKARLGPPPVGVRTGIGDDAAILEACDEPLVWTVDAVVEDVHFRRSWGLFDVGYRATMAASSDLAAMGARPLSLLAALVLPDDIDDEDLGAIADGQATAARALGTAVVGGNLARGRELSITTTALGASSEPMQRIGARPGDALWLAGPVGLAAAGLAWLDRGLPRDGAHAGPALTALLRPVARIEAGLAARSRASAAIDVSDGLAADLAHLARASGVRAVIDPATFVGPELHAVAGELGLDARDLALFGGEDYALVVAAPGGAELPGFVRIGGCEARHHDGPVAVVGADGRVTTIEPHGFDHFRKS